MKNKKKCITIILLTILLIYITNITSIPKNIILFQNEKYQISHLKGFEISGDIKNEEKNLIEKISTINSELVGNLKLKLTALGIFPIKDITVSVIPQSTVIPSGKAIGLKIYSKGVLVIGKDSVDGIDGKRYEPYLEAGIEKGDLILKIDEYEIETIDELIYAIRKSNGKDIKILCERNGKTFESVIKPIRSIDDNNYKLGLWVRDGVMGIGTATFYNPATGEFVGVGHGISDADVDSRIAMDYGTVNEVNLLSVLPSKKSKPGEIVGTLDSFEEYGEVIANKENGIYGKIYESEKEHFITREAVCVASRNEVEIGEAKILSTLENGVIEEFEIEIQRKYSDSNNESKSMIIKIIDEELLNRTGGIVQGMSGSPIIQNGKLVGALTHVFVNDPTRGYAVFADTMVNNIT